MLVSLVRCCREQGTVGNEKGPLEDPLLKVSDMGVSEN